MALVAQLLLLSFPWTLGTILAVGFVWVRADVHYSTPKAFLLAGVGGPIGYLVFAWILNTAAGQLFFDDGNLGVIATVAGLQVAVLLYMATLSLMRRGASGFNIGARSPSAYLLLLWLISLTTFVYSIWWLPALGYDVLDHWAVKANQLIAQLQPSGMGQLENMHRHPNTLKWLLAWNAWASNETGGNTFILLPWLLMTFSLQVALVAFVLIISGSMTLGLLVATGAATVPLLENHVLLAGYAELPITVFLSLSCALVAIGILERRSGYQLMVIIVALALISLKGSGLLYALLPLIGLLLTHSYEGSRSHWYFLICLLVVGACLVIFSITFTVHGNLYDLMASGFEHLAGEPV